MRLIVAAGLFIPLVTVSANAADKSASMPKASAPRQCAVAAEQSKSMQKPKAQSGLLNAQPDATEIRTLYRVIDSCPAPLVGRTGIGSKPGPDTDRPETPFSVQPAH